MKKTNLTLSVVTALVMSACGGQAYPPSNSASNSDSGTSQTSNTSNQTNTTSTDNGSGSNIPADPYDFSVFGVDLYNSTIPAKSQATISSSIVTDNILKIDVSSAGPASFGNYSAYYNCVQIPVTVSPTAISESTLPSSTGMVPASVPGNTLVALVSTTGSAGTGSCAGAQPTVTLDFSRYLTGSHSQMTVVIRPNPTTNSYIRFDNCHSSTNYYSYGNYIGYLYPGCSLNPLPSTYSLPGHLEIHTNGTQ